MSERFVMGIVGEAGSGKGEVSRILVESGFIKYSLSDSLRSTASDLGLTKDRDSLITMGNVLRDRFGGDILARGAEIWMASEIGRKIVIESIRNPAEVDYLKSRLGALIVGVTMLPEKRFELMRERRRVGDPATWEEFQILINREQGVGEKSSGQQVRKCMELTDILLSNNGTIEELKKQIMDILDYQRRF